LGEFDHCNRQGTGFSKSLQRSGKPGVSCVFISDSAKVLFFCGDTYSLNIILIVGFHAEPKFRGNHPAFTLVSWRAYSSTLKIEATCSSETLVGFQRTTRRYIPEDKTLHPVCFCLGPNFEAGENFIIRSFKTCKLLFIR
jgi:hypothetical protein